MCPRYDTSTCATELLRLTWEQLNNLFCNNKASWSRGRSYKTLLRLKLVDWLILSLYSLDQPISLLEFESEIDKGYTFDLILVCIGIGPCLYHADNTSQDTFSRALYLGLGRYGYDTIRYVSRYGCHDPIRIAIYRHYHAYTF